MPKFCPNCGNQMSDNAKFCMECGAKLGDYTSGGGGIEGNVIQRSKIDMTSVGKVEISPKINATATAAGGFACRICKSPATTRCGHCKTYVCGECLKKLYYVNEYDGGAKTIEQIMFSPPVFFCKECFETPRIQKEETDWSIKRWGFFSNNELNSGEICYKCRKFSLFLNKVYSVSENDTDTKTIEQIISYPHVFLCNDCFKARKIERKLTEEGVFKRWGYLTVNELKPTEETCENCGNLSLHFLLCESCRKIFCEKCKKKGETRKVNRFVTIEGDGCPYCNALHSWKVI